MAASLRGLHPEVRAAAEWALGWASHFRVPIHVTSTFRSWEQQAELRRRFELGLSRWPANRPGDSAHNYGLAWDSVVALRSDDPRLASYQRWWNHVRQLAGFRVPSHDEIHAEVPNWRRLV